VGAFACEANGLGPMPVTYAQCCPEPEADTCVRSDAEEVRRPLHYIALHYILLVATGSCLLSCS
jgi:hypothetical protein